MAQQGVYKITSIEDGPPNESEEEVEYDFGETYFSSRALARRVAKEIYPTGGYRIWKMPRHKSWCSDWELADQVKGKKVC